MITTQDIKATREMSFEDAGMILRRKPIGLAEMKVARIALLTLKGAGYSKREIEMEAGRGLSYSEELVLHEFAE